MKITIKTTNVELTPAIQSYVETKVGSVERLLTPESAAQIDANVEVGKPSQHHHSGPIFTAEVNFHMGGILMRASAEDADLYAAIDKIKDELHMQIVKFKDKEISQRRHNNPDTEV